MRIDLNCDMGESFGVYSLGLDAEVMNYVTSANIACGFHAGDPAVMERTLQLAAEHSVAVGAHVSYPDLQGFGRRFIDMSIDEVRQVTLYQLGALAGMARPLGLSIQHVKTHGSLYNRAERDEKTAQGLVEGIAAFDDRLIIYATPGSAMEAVATRKGLRVGREAFADRAYNRDGTLVSRKLEGAVLHDPDIIASRVVRLVRDGEVTTIDGGTLLVEPDTICLHGDNPTAVKIARTLREALAAEGIVVAPAGAVANDQVSVQGP